MMTTMRAGILLVVLAAAMFGGCNWLGGEKPATDGQSATPPGWPAAAGAPAPASYDPVAAPEAGASAPAADPAATATPDPATATAEKAPVYKIADDKIVVGRAFTYTVRPNEGGGWAVIKTALCNVITADGETVGRDQYRECWVPTRDIAIQICDLIAGRKARGGEEPSNVEEFELSTGEWCYLDDAAGQIWVARKSDTGQHHGKWLFAQAAPGQAGKIFARVKAELEARHGELVARRKAELQRLETAGMIPGNPS